MQNVGLKPLPLGEVSPQVTERASSVRKSRRTAIGSPFVRAKLSRRLRFFGSVLALSGASRQLSQRESRYTLLASSSLLRFGTQ